MFAIAVIGIFSEFEKALKERQVGAIILFTSKGDFTEHFYHKQNMKSNPQMVFMEKKFLRKDSIYNGYKFFQHRADCTSGT